MKSSFLLLLILSSLITQVWAQTPAKKTPAKKKPAPAAQAGTPTAASPAAASTAAPADESGKSDFDKFYERLSIGYSSTFTSPTLKDWDSRYAALSPGFTDEFQLDNRAANPEFRGRRNSDSYAMNLWNAFNFSYNYGGTFKFHIIPRFTLFLDRPVAEGAGNQGMIMMEDWFVGFSGVVLASEDKKFSWWMRPGTRLPTSRASRNNAGAYGSLSHQPEITNVFGYTINPIWSAELTYQARFWVYEDRYNYARMRNLIAPTLTYSYSDPLKFFFGYELMLQNERDWKSIDGESPYFQDIWQNGKVGFAYDVTQKFNVSPYLNVFVNDIPLSMNSAFIGIDFSYSIK